MPLVNVLINSTTAGVGSGRVQRGNAPPPIFLDYLAVGGGGYATTFPGQQRGAAGGGGGVVSGSVRFLPRFTLDITVGNGGIGSTRTAAEPSIIDVSNPAGEFFVYAGGGDLGTSGAPQNNPAAGNSNYSQGGAGGSSSPGGDTYDGGAHGGNGGTGSLWLDGNYYAGGGGGFGRFFIPTQGVGGTGGLGGGGNGASKNGAGSNGVPNTGGGAGGCQDGVDPLTSNGGSGIVKMRYISGSVTGATGGTIEVTGSYVYHTFTGSGQFVYQP